MGPWARKSEKRTNPSRVRGEIGRRDVEFADLDATAHLPDLGHPDEVSVLDQREEPSLAVAARDLGPQGLRPRVQEGEDPQGVREVLPRRLPEGRQLLLE